MSSRAWGNKALLPQVATFSKPELSTQRKGTLLQTAVGQGCFCVAESSTSALSHLDIPCVRELLLQASDNAHVSFTASLWAESSWYGSQMWQGTALAHSIGFLGIASSHAIHVSHKE